MRMAVTQIKKFCRKKSLTLKELLAKAGVSKTAYYHLVYKDSLLPRSMHDLADALDVRLSDLIEDESDAVRATRALLHRTDAIMEAHPTLDRENVRHTLILLQEKPIARLRRALIRGR